MAADEFLPQSLLFVSPKTLYPPLGWGWDKSVWVSGELTFKSCMSACYCKL